MLADILMLFGSTFLQNASFTLVSRARNSKSLGFHAIASTLSNGIWLLVIRQVVQNLNSTLMMAVYLVASVLGAVFMHWFSMTHLEKGKRAS